MKWVLSMFLQYLIKQKVNKNIMHIQYKCISSYTLCSFTQENLTATMESSDKPNVIKK